MSRKLSFEHVDVFSKKPFRGNQLAVFRNPGRLSPQRMLSIAREINFSETVFIFPSKLEDADAKVRIFTPSEELPFAGHPVLGAADVILRHRKGRKPSELVLELRSGMIKVDIIKKGNSKLFSMNQPVPEFGTAVQNRGQVARGLGLKRYEILGGGVVSNGLSFLMIEVEGEEIVSRAKLNLEQASNVISRHGVCGIYLFARINEGGENIRARFFAPGLSVWEDPATGSAAGAMGGYLARLLKFPNKLSLKVRQGIEMGRPSEIKVFVRCERGMVKSVSVTGSVVLVGKGTLQVP
ncbi:MAG TPA: PhzF family phenazine biosynthesis protein [Candidatus Krumholzibacteriaceae bacterium]|nr:PhzF family phenazine biosynthesis protein [Candidatus Krumholzibacteriaceae bacterium]